MVYQAYGEDVPQRGRPPVNQLENDDAGTDILTNSNYINLDELFQSARALTEQSLGNWQTISLALPDSNADQVVFAINQSLGGQPQKQFTLELLVSN